MTIVSVQHIGDWVTDFKLWSVIGDSVSRHWLSIGASQVVPWVGIRQNIITEVSFHSGFVKPFHLKLV